MIHIVDKKMSEGDLICHDQVVRMRVRECGSNVVFIFLTSALCVLCTSTWFYRRRDFIWLSQNSSSQNWLFILLFFRVKMIGWALAWKFYDRPTVLKILAGQSCFLTLRPVGRSQNFGRTKSLSDSETGRSVTKFGRTKLIIDSSIFHTKERAVNRVVSINPEHWTLHPNPQTLNS